MNFCLIANANSAACTGPSIVSNITKPCAVFVAGRGSGFCNVSTPAQYRIRLWGTFEALDIFSVLPFAIRHVYESGLLRGAGLTFQVIKFKIVFYPTS
jgi:hypothetical protein